MYLKTTYRNRCEEEDRKCADHCRIFALSHAGDTDVQKVCSHSHNVRCEDCEKLKSIFEGVKGAISEYTMQLGRFQREARNTVMDEIGLKHPIMFDIYDVCSLAREARLPSLKVKMLRDMCKHFELAFKMQDTNAAPLAKMEEMISECRCYAI